MGFFDSLKSGAKIVGDFAGDVTIQTLKNNIHTFSDEALIRSYERSIELNNTGWKINEEMHEVYKKEMKKRGLI